MALRTWDSLFNWPTFDLWEVAPRHGSSSSISNSSSFSSALNALGAVDVTENAAEYLIVADTPGMTNNEVKVEIKGNTLQFSGERKEEHREEREDKKFYRIERSQSSFSRSFRLPADSDPAKIKASCQDGVLKITLPKRAASETAGTQVSVAASH
eukprot:m.116570 g.116570  ORF g.116570 m.116570 type:complete len:155 (+) comp51943_c0_seq2:199-663(+)